MRLLPAAVVLVLVAGLLAGCSDNKRRDPGTPIVPEAPHLVQFVHEADLPQVAGGGEPNIAALADGTLFVTVPVGGSDRPNVQQGSAYLWRSRDGGDTWDVLRSPQLLPVESAPTVGAFCSCDADVTTSPDGWVYYSDWWIAGSVGAGNYLVESSADGGDTWTSNPIPIPQNLVASMDRQWLVAGEGGFVALFYSFFASTPILSVGVPLLGLGRPGQAIEAVFSTDHGQSWTDPVAVVPASDRGLQIGHPRIGPDGNVWMAYGSVIPDEDFWRDPSEVRVVVADRVGKVLSDVLVAEVPEGFDNLWAVQGAQDPDTGRSYAVWAGRVDDDVQAVSLAWSDDRQSWSTPHVLDGTGVNFLPWVDARAGNVVAGWYGADLVGDPEEATEDDGWFAYAAEWRAGGNLSLVAPGKVSAEPVKTGPLCPRGAACGTDRELLDYVSMVYTPTGALYYAFARSDGASAFVHVASTLHPGMANTV